MTSEQAFVWITLPGQTTPIVAGRLTLDHEGGTFVYGRTYLSNAKAVPFDPVELALADRPYHVAPDRNSGLPGAIRDASPDHWGRYLLGAFRGSGMSEIALLLGSPDDRVGALSFSPSPQTPPLQSHPAPTAEALESLGAAIIRQQEELAPRATDALAPSPRTQAIVDRPRTSLGGARPKITVLVDGSLWLAKAGRPDDAFDFPRTEAAMLDLARLCGIDTPAALVRRFGRRDALLVKRFDREIVEGGSVLRTRFSSALCCLKADEMDARPRSYLRLTDEIRRVGRPSDGPELFRRMVFNALINNDDDHLRNHGLIASGGGWRLSPVYDLVPHPTTSYEVRLALRVADDAERTVTASRLIACSGRFGLSEAEAAATVARMTATVAQQWEPCLRERGVNDTQIGYLRTAFLKPGLGIENAGLPEPQASGELRARIAPRSAPIAVEDEASFRLIVARTELETAVGLMTSEARTRSSEPLMRGGDAPHDANAVVRAILEGREGLSFTVFEKVGSAIAPTTTLLGQAAAAALLEGFGRRQRYRSILIDPLRAIGCDAGSARRAATMATFANAKAATADRVVVTLRRPGTKLKMSAPAAEPDERR